MKLSLSSSEDMASKDPPESELQSKHQLVGPLPIALQSQQERNHSHQSANLRFHQIVSLRFKLIYNPITAAFCRVFSHRGFLPEEKPSLDSVVSRSLNIGPRDLRGFQQFAFMCYVWMSGKVVRSSLSSTARRSPLGARQHADGDPDRECWACWRFQDPVLRVADCLMAPPPHIPIAALSLISDNADVKFSPHLPPEPKGIGRQDTMSLPQRGKRRRNKTVKQIYLQAYWREEGSGGGKTTPTDYPKDL
ncbi:hypothetical protein EYF80_001362 [Liparis tanakae]|uniref:Uncharacterized protein n=1 Tax=Liparis tanakae TaxID=230148 RepID=A0A4Z2JEA9_9TELE|nr:hypothetical protein EYF80_001362 [Liparis tanakae]